MVRENSLERDKSYSRIIFFLGLIFRVFVIEMIFLRAWESLRCSVYLSGDVFRAFPDIFLSLIRKNVFKITICFLVTFWHFVSRKLLGLSESLKIKAAGELTRNGNLIAFKLLDAGYDKLFTWGIFTKPKSFIKNIEVPLH